MKKYNIQAAIALRGLTLSETNMFDPTQMHPKYEAMVIDFRNSIEMTSGDFDWGNIPLHIEVLCGYQESRQVELRTNTTKAVWKRAYHNWREYIRQCNDRSYTNTDKYSCV